jgi:hypothetical protein
MSDKFVSIRNVSTGYAIIINGVVEYVFSNKDAAIKFARSV